MSQQSVSITNITHVSGAVEIHLSNGSSIGFSSVTEFKDWIQSWREQLPLILLAMGLDKYRNVDPDFSNIGVIVGKSVSYDSNAGSGPLVEII